MQSIKKSLWQFLWVAPFLLFLLTYFMLHKVLSKPPFAAPSIVGKSVQDALRFLAEHTLNARLISQIENNDVPIGTVLSQHPLAEQKIRPYQTVFVTVSKRKERFPAPPLLEKSCDAVKNILEKDAISFKIYGFTSPKNGATPALHKFHHPKHYWMKIKR